MATMSYIINGNKFRRIPIKLLGKITIYELHFDASNKNDCFEKLHKNVWLSYSSRRCKATQWCPPNSRNKTAAYTISYVVFVPPNKFSAAFKLERYLPSSVLLTENLFKISLPYCEYATHDRLIYDLTWCGTAEQMSPWQALKRLVIRCPGNNFFRVLAILCGATVWAGSSLMND